jgi:hypothetical protein
MPVYNGNLSLSSRVIGWMSDMIYPALPFLALHRLRQGTPHEQHHLVGRSSRHRSLHTRILWTQVEGTNLRSGRQSDSIDNDTKTGDMRATLFLP